jgi:pimeloyl-ACP methyl ester carboxylesterase
MYFLRYQLYNNQGFELAPKFISALLSRDTNAIKELGMIPSVMLRVGNMSAFLSFQAYEEYPPGTAIRTAQAITAAPELAGGFAWFQALIPALETWHDARISPQEHTLENISPPTLILVNEYDPVTPPENTRLFDMALVQPTVIRLNRFGHGSGGDCIDQISLDFLRDPQTAPDMGCLEKED